VVVIAFLCQLELTLYIRNQ